MLKLKDFYPDTMYTPMPEMHNLNIPVTAGCNYNYCRYCDLNALQKFRLFDLDKIKTYIRDQGAFYADQRRQPKKLTLLEGNALCCPTDFLLEIMEEVHINFKQVEYIATFARTYDILQKTEEELKSLKDAGLDRLSIGIESGSTEVLAHQRKRVTAEQQLQALKKLEAIGIRYTCYIMIGLGGQKWTQQHALETAEFLNQVRPEELTVVTMVIFKGAALAQDIRQGKFQRLKVQDTIKEEILLLENLTLSTIFNGTHPTNAVPIKGKLPEQKEFLLSKLKEILASRNNDKLHLSEVIKWRNISARY